MKQGLERRQRKNNVVQSFVKRIVKELQVRELSLVLCLHFAVDFCFHRVNKSLDTISEDLGALWTYEWPSKFDSTDVTLSNLI